MTRLPIGLFLGCVLAVGGVGLGLVGHADAQEPQASEPADPASADPATPADTATTDLSGLVPPPTAGPRRPKWEDIVVVPRKAFLKSGRLELSPFSGVSLNDVLIRHYALGGELNYYLTDVFSVGLQGQYFIKERTDREGVVGLQYNRVPTLNKYRYAAALNFGYVPGYGKFSLFNRYILHWDIFASAGVGIVRTEIIPRLISEPSFQSTNIAPNFGVGSRMFLGDWLTFSLSIRDYVFNDKFEPVNRTRGEDVNAVKSRASSQLVNNLMLYAAVGFYLPTSFEYRTPR